MICEYKEETKIVKISTLKFQNVRLGIHTMTKIYVGVDNYNTTKLKTSNRKCFA